MRKVFIILLVCLTSQTSFAQKTGSFITTNGENHSGKIYLRLEEQRVDELVVKIDKERTTFKAHKILSLVFENGDTIKTIKYKDRYQFAKVVHAGPFLNYYKIADIGQERKELTMPLLVKQDNSDLEIGNFGFKGRMTKFLKQCPDLTDKIAAGEIKKSRLKDIVVMYNDCMSSNQTKSPTNVSKVSIEEQPAMEKLINKVSSSGLENKSDILEMLKDVKAKLEEGESVPKYLKGAIIEAFGDNQEFVQAFEAAIS